MVLEAKTGLLGTRLAGSAGQEQISTSRSWFKKDFVGTGIGLHRVHKENRLPRSLRSSFNFNIFTPHVSSLAAFNCAISKSKMALHSALSFTRAVSSMTVMFESNMPPLGLGCHGLGPDILTDFLREPHAALSSVLFKEQ